MSGKSLKKQEKRSVNGAGNSENWVTFVSNNERKCHQKELEKKKPRSRPQELLPTTERVQTLPVEGDLD